MLAFAMRYRRTWATWRARRVASVVAWLPTTSRKKSSGFLGAVLVRRAKPLWCGVDLPCNAGPIVFPRFGARCTPTVRRRRLFDMGRRDRVGPLGKMRVEHFLDAHADVRIGVAKHASNSQLLR